MPMNLGKAAPAIFPPAKNPAPPPVFASPLVTASNLASSNNAPYINPVTCSLKVPFDKFDMYLTTPVAPATLFKRANSASTGTNPATPSVTRMLIPLLNTSFCLSDKSIPASENNISA